MLKYFIIFIIILVVLDLILLIPIEARIVKRIEKPLLLKVLVFKKTIFQMELKKKAKPKQKSSFQFKISYLFENDLNIILKDLKEENFFVYLLLEFAKIKKVTFIPTFNSSDPIMMPYLGFLDWFIISNIKNYIDHTFHVVKDDYYQIIAGERRYRASILAGKEAIADKLTGNVVKEIYVNEGATLKRMRARAKGSGNRILKRTSHITVVVADNN